MKIVPSTIVSFSTTSNTFGISSSFVDPLTSGLIVFLCATTEGSTQQAVAKQCAAIFASALASREVWPSNVTHSAQHLLSHDARGCRLLRFILQLRDEVHDFMNKGCTIYKRNSKDAVFGGYFCS